MGSSSRRTVRTPSPTFLVCATLSIVCTVVLPRASAGAHSPEETRPGPQSVVEENASKWNSTGVAASTVLDLPPVSTAQKSKVEVLGEILKKHVAMLRRASKKQVELVFLVDSSASVGADNFFNELKFVKKLLADFTVSYNTTRVAVVTYSSRTRVVQQINHVTAATPRNHKCRLLEEELPKITYSGGGTYTLGAVLEAQRILRNARPEAVRAIFLVTDGFSNGGDPRPAAKRLRNEGVLFFTFGIQNGNVKELYDMASEPKQEHSYILDSFDEFEALARRALHEDLHIGSFEEEEPNMCFRLCEEGVNCCDPLAKCTCGTHTGHYACVCQKGFYGTGLTGDCKPCPAGTYLDSYGPADVSGCKPCPNEHHNSEPGSTTVEACFCRKGYVAVNETECVEMQCPSLIPPENGYFVKKVCNTVFNAACGIRCNPGYRLVGSSIRLCGENGRWTGEQPSCAIKSCPVLKTPRHGSMNCSNENFVFETQCNFTCEAGFTLVGSKSRTCLAISSWDGLPSHCRPVTCSALMPIAHGIISPSKCTTHKSLYGDLCDFACQPGFQLVGPMKRQCIEQGVWSSAEKKSRCIDIAAPNITCPSDIEMETDENENWASITWDPPQVMDNSGDEVSLSTVPVITFPMRFPIGNSTVVYTAQDKAKNEANCTLFVTVIDSQPPTVDRCVSPPTFLSREKDVEVIWDDPLFSDNSGNQVHVRRSRDPGVFPYGETEVVYIAWDDAGNNTTCTIIITVQEHECPMLVDPINGHANCSESASQNGVICSLTCREGYAFAFRPPASYLCTFDAGWPQTVESLPDCSVTILPKDAVQNGIITLQSDDVPCDDSFFLHQVETKFQKKLSNKITQYCYEEIDCGVTYVSAECEEFLSKYEEGSNYILRRRRDIRTDLERKEEKIRPQSDYRFLVPVVPGSSDHFTDLQKVALRFQITGSSKPNSTRDTAVLSSALVNAMHALRTDAQKGELDLHMGQRHLTYSGLRLLSEQPSFVCEPGSVLQDDRCVKCPVGTFYNVVRETCEGCSVGTYQFEEGQLSCLVCPENTSTSHGQAKSFGECKTQCLPGTISSDGLEVCETCERGYFQSEYARSSCIKCPTNTTTWRRGVRKERECREMCPKGQVSETGLVPCYACPLGYYQPAVGKRVCYRCPNGSPTKLTGSLSETDCLELQRLEFGFKPPVEELLVNECFSVPCFNGGTCKVLDFGYVCDCAAGFTGMHCESEVNECDSNPCQNGGRCTDLLNGYVCQCTPGYQGYNCDVDIDECASNPCLHGSTCIDQINDFLCKCVDGFQGRMCENNIDECASHPCMNGGACLDGLAYYTCTCPVGFVGSTCETDVDECESGPCQNGGTCLDQQGQFACSCPPGFTGTVCEVNVDECASAPCLNGATCVDQVNSLECLCPPGYGSPLCETELSSDFVLYFPISGIMDYAQAEGFRRYLSQASVCFWMKSSDGQNYGTPVSYANISMDNAFTLTDYNGFVFYVNGEKVITDVTANDGQWHFICATWTSAGGLWRIYKDGEMQDEGKNLSSGTLIPGDGTIVIGQEQDNLLGGFSAAESFIGYMAWVEFWDRVLSPQEVYRLSATCDKVRGSVRSWADFLSGMKGRVKLEESTFCKGCPKSVSLTNGQVNISGTGMMNILSYKCDSGYVLKGLSKRRCLSHGQWEGKSPECRRVSCGFPGYLENGQIQGNGYLFGDVLQYVCFTGYHLIGAETRVCQADEQWSGKPAKCHEYLCPPLPVPINGSMINQTAHFRVASKAAYQCDPGYQLDGPPELMCSPDGHWDEEPPTCQPVFCSEPPRLQNGRVIAEEMDRQKPDSNASLHYVRVGEKVRLSCNPGYVMVGKGELLCSDESRWKGEMPQCVPVDCGGPPVIPNGILLRPAGQNTVLGSMIEYICQEGFSPANITIMCSSAGKWETTEGGAASCISRICPTPQGIRYGEVKVSSVTVGSTVEYSCMEGYQLSGPEIRSCLSNGTWSGRVPTCSLTTCSPLEDIAHGHIDFGKMGITEGRPIVAGTTVIHSCEHGYRRQGPSQRTCLDGRGEWHPDPRVTPTTCLPMECPLPSAIQNGFHAEEHLSIIFGDILHYACEDGYQLEGNGSRECLEDGMWSGAPPKCRKVSCGSLDNIKHGKVVYLEAFTYLSQVKYACNPGFQLQGGPEVRTCLANGSWSDQEPFCEVAHCPPLDTPLHGEVNLSVAELGIVAEYKCHNGYVLEGPVERRCVEINVDGKSQLEWSPQGLVPVCSPIYCMIPDAPNGLIVRAPFLRFQSIAEYECAAGYQPVSAEEDFHQVCQSDGSWSGATPKCQPSECPPPPGPVTNGKLLWGSVTGIAFTIGMIIQYECAAGHKLVGLQNITCTDAQVWSGEAPKCEPVYCEWPLADPYHGQFLSESEVYHFGQRVDFQCDEGYEVPEGGRGMMCLANGQWSREFHGCRPVSCDQPENIPNGMLELVSGNHSGIGWVDYGSVVQYSCRDDHVLIGNAYQHCGADKRWSPSVLPHCDLIRCTEHPRTIQNGHCSTNVSLPVSVGTTAICSCNMGYQLKDNSTMVCISPGQWSIDIPECLPAMCEPPPEITNGTVLAHSGNIFGSFVEFHCNEGHQLVGEHSVKCGADGFWSGPFPVCSITSCPPPPPILNGRISAEEFTIGAKITYSCNKGYYLTGTANLTCLADNTWAAIEPTGNKLIPPKCEVVHCSDPPLQSPDLTILMTPLGQTNTSFVFGSSVTLSCWLGHTLRIKDSDSTSKQTWTFMCGDDGHWNPPMDMLEKMSCEAISCEAPPEIENAIWKMTTGRRLSQEGSSALGKQFLWGSAVQYTCQEGYVLETENANHRVQALQCLGDGYWIGSDISCQSVACPQPGQLDHGNVHWNSTVYKGVVNFTCDDGYQLVGGPDQYWCSSGGFWSPKVTDVHCEEILCEDMEPLRHGTYQIMRGNGRAVNSVVTAECNSEYHLIDGDAIRTCLSDGTWSGQKPYCMGMECPIPEELEYGIIELDSTLVGGVVQYQCDLGYEMKGTAVLTCMADGSWSQEAPTCVPVECPELSILSNGVLSITDGYRFESIAEYSCNYGFQMVMGVDDNEVQGGKLMCLANGTWAGQMPIACMKVHCGPPEGIANGEGNVTFKSDEVGAEAFYKCDWGHMMYGGSPVRVCQADGSWNGTSPFCSVVVCPPLEDTLANGHMEIEVENDDGDARVGSSFRLGVSLKFFCAPMYILRGSSYIHCLENGLWDAAMPQCVRSHCDKPAAIADGSVKGDLFAIDDVVTYECLSGFQLEGVAKHRCMENGSWEGVVPRCLPISCGTPPNVSNSVIQLVIPHGQVPHSYGSTAVYACPEGYELSGSPVLVCESNGTWLGHIPSCEQLTCGPPPVLPHATVQVESYEHLSRAIYYCDQGFRMSENPVVHCLASGLWDVEDKELECERVVCGPPLPIPNGRLVISGHKFGATVNYTCLSGFQLVTTTSSSPLDGGGSHLICSGKGQWIGRRRRCLLLTCPPPELPSNSQLEDNSGEFRYGLAVNYTCRTGYRLVGKSTRMCLNTGEWSGNVPQCHRVHCQEPEPPKNGYVMIDDRRYGDVARFACEEGYQLDGASQITCDINGEWQSATPLCRALTCYQPNVSDTHVNRFPLEERYPLGAVVQLTCRSGYRPTADMSVYCQVDGSWSLPSGKCKRVSCGPPRISNGAIVLGNSFAFEDKLAYICPPGTSPKGFPVLTCQENGTWDSLPACEALCEKSCMNGGKCIGPEKCRCLAGFVGDRCQHAVCILPCLNGGTCVGPYRCACKSKYTGSRCHIPFCSVSCLYGGTCIGYNLCACLPHYSGSQCQEPLCDPPCPNGKRCTAPNSCH